MKPSVISGTYRGCGISARQHIFRHRGDVHNGHYHVKDHVTFVCAGAVLACIEGHEPVEVRAPAFIEIKADKRHGFTALEDGTIYYCVFAGDDPGDSAACASCGVCPQFEVETT